MALFDYNFVILFGVEFVEVLRKVDGLLGQRLGWVFLGFRFAVYHTLGFHLLWIMAKQECIFLEISFMFLFRVHFA